MRRLWQALLSTLAALLCAELVARVAGWGEPPGAARRIEPEGFSPFIRDGDGPLCYRPGARFAFIYDTRTARPYLGPDGRVEYRINALGARGEEIRPEKPSNVYRAVCIGDSIAFGEGVHEQDTYSAKLVGHLEAKLGREVEVLNAGVQAYGTVEAVEHYLRHCQRFDPDLVVLEFFLNDATEFQETIRHHLEGVEGVPLSGIATWSKLGAFIQRKLQARARMRDYFETTRSSFSSPRWEACRKSLGIMQDLAQQRGFRFLVVVFPILWKLDSYPFDDVHELVAQACGDLGIESLDLLEDLRGLDARTLWVHPRDHHPNELVHALAAERIAEVVTASR